MKINRGDKITRPILAWFLINVFGSISPNIKMINEIKIMIDRLFQPTDKKCNVAKVVATIFDTLVPSKIKNKNISFSLIILLERLDNLPPCLLHTSIWKGFDESKAISRLENKIEKIIPMKEKSKSSI